MSGSTHVDHIKGLLRMAQEANQRPHCVDCMVYYCDRLFMIFVARFYLLGGGGGGPYWKPCCPLLTACIMCSVHGGSVQQATMPVACVIHGGYHGGPKDVDHAPSPRQPRRSSNGISICSQFAMCLSIPLKNKRNNANQISHTNFVAIHHQVSPID